MPDTGALHFVGAMHPDTFLQAFMQPTELDARIPQVDYSRVPSRGSVPDMCRALVKCIEKAKACPGARFFRTRTTRQWLNEVTMTTRSFDSDESLKDEAEVCDHKFKYSHFPALAARTRPRPRKGTKRKLDIVEAYDYATALLDVEVHHCSQADPFTDPSDETNHGPSTPGPTSTTFHARAEIRLTPVPPPCSRPPMDQPEQSKASHHRPESQRSSTRQKPISGSSSSGSYYQLFENPSHESTTFRASLVSHAAAQFTRRHRVFFFQLVIVDRWARFIRWDRSGAICTERFDYVSRPDLLSGFFWRFAHLTDEQRGLDTTATLATTQEKHLFREAVQDFTDDMKAGHKNGVPVRRIPNAERMVDDAKTFPVWKVHVVDSTTQMSTNLLVGRPLSDVGRVFGRATRAYIAYDLGDRRLVFLKDTWRADHPKLSAESTTYSALRKNKVPHIPNVLYGGDVYDGRLKPQETLTQLYAEDEDDWRITNNVHERYTHHRIVQDIAYPLESALDVKEFVQVIQDALVAMQKAHSNIGLLHRDLSIGNIMIDRSGRGVLNDWDHAGSVEEPARGVGTWRFMSIPLLSKPEKLHDIADDLESVYWVLLYGAMKLFASKDQDLPLDVFDWHGIDGNNRRIGGLFKNAWISNSSRLFALGLSSPALQELILDSQRCWLIFHNIRDNLMNLNGLDDLRDRMTKIFEQAPDPSFWIDKYAATLRSLEEQERAPTRPTTSSEDHEQGTRYAQQLGDADAPMARAMPAESAAGERNSGPVEQRARRQDAPPTCEPDIVPPTSSLSRKRRAEDLDPSSLRAVPLFPSKRRRVQS